MSTEEEEGERERAVVSLRLCALCGVDSPYTVSLVIRGVFPVFDVALAVPAVLTERCCCAHENREGVRTLDPLPERLGGRLYSHFH